MHTYVCNWSGRLFRVSEGSLKPGCSAMITIRTPKPLFVTRFADNLLIAATRARIFAADDSGDSAKTPCERRRRHERRDDDHYNDSGESRFIEDALTTHR